VPTPRLSVLFFWRVLVECTLPTVVRAPRTNEGRLLCLFSSPSFDLFFFFHLPPQPCWSGFRLSDDVSSGYPVCGHARFSRGVFPLPSFRRRCFPARLPNDPRSFMRILHRFTFLRLFRSTFSVPFSPKIRDGSR